jgi:hypothetical protein
MPKSSSYFETPSPTLGGCRSRLPRSLAEASQGLAGPRRRKPVNRVFREVATCDFRARTHLYHHVDAAP